MAEPLGALPIQSSSLCNTFDLGRAASVVRALSAANGKGASELLQELQQLLPKRTQYYGFGKRGVREQQGCMADGAWYDDTTS